MRWYQTPVGPRFFRGVAVVSIAWALLDLARGRPAASMLVLPVWYLVVDAALTWNSRRRDGGVEEPTRRG